MKREKKKGQCLFFWLFDPGILHEASRKRGEKGGEGKDKIKD